MSEKSHMNEFKKTLFDNGYPEEFLLFVKKSKMTLKESGTLTDNLNIQYVRNLLCGEALHQFDTLCI